MKHLLFLLPLFSFSVFAANSRHISGKYDQQDTAVLNTNFDNITHQFNDTVQKTSTQTISGYITFDKDVTFQSSITANAQTTFNDPILAQDSMTVNALATFKRIYVTTVVPPAIVGSDGDVFFGRNDANAGTIPDFRWDNTNHQLMLRGMTLGDVGDPIDLILQRAGPSLGGETYATGLSSITTNINLGNVYWRGYGSNGDFGCVSDAGRSAQIAAFSAEGFNGTARGAHLLLFTTPIGACVPVARIFISQNGRVGLGGNQYPGDALELTGGIIASGNIISSSTITSLVSFSAANGSAGGPSITFASENDAGFYRTGDGVGVSAGGQSQATITSSGITISTITTFSSLLTLASNSQPKVNVKPTAAYQLIVNSTSGDVCMSTGSTSGAWVLIYSTITACQN